MIIIQRCLLLGLLLLGTACTGGQATPPPTNAVVQTAPTEPAIPPASATSSTEPSPTTAVAPRTLVETVTTFDSPAAEETPSPSPQPSPTLDPGEWQSLPIIPVAGDVARKIYRRSLELGNNPQAFSKIGDCGSTPAWFLGDFDRGPRYYRLGPHQDLEGVIQAFQGSFDRTSLAAKAGFNASSVFTPLWADRKQCQPDEAPLACEYRLHRPAMAFIMLGTNDVYHPDSFEPRMRQLIEFSIENGVIPILSTKADNEEGDGSLNATIARLAFEYGVPLWNYWLAVQPLPDHGLQEDGVHITWGPNRFDDPHALTRGWTVRNLTALQVLDAVWRYVTTEN